MKTLYILIVEDNPEDSALLQLFLTRAGMKFEATVVDDREAYIKALLQHEFDIILSDHSLPGFNSSEAVSLAKNADRHIPFIVITGSLPETEALKLSKEGVDDYILKSNLIRLPLAIKNAIELKQLRRDAQGGRNFR